MEREEELIVSSFGFVEIVERNLDYREIIWIRLMNLGHRLGCHQLADRSFSINGYQFPVCARCTGVILSTFVAIPLFFKYRISIKSGLLLSSVMFIDWFIQYLGIKSSNNIRRFVTGFLGGLGWTYINLYFYKSIYKCTDPQKLDQKI